MGLRQDLATDVPRLIWDQIQKAHELPDMIQANDHTLVLKLGERVIGWSLLGQSQERPGPALDLTTATRVRLVAKAFPERPTIIDRESYQDTTSIHHYLSRLFNLLDVDAAVTDAADGEATFTLTDGNLDSVGRFIAQVQVTFADGSKKSPGLLKFNLVPGII